MGLIITGMHRSGTSALARVAEAIGLPSGGLDMGPAPDNPRGFFERRDVVKVNDSWLADLGGSWWAPPEMTSTTWRTLDRDRLAADRSALGLFDPGQGPWMVKDPRISLLMPLWDRLALQTLPAVVAVRDPREVAGSLELRNGIPARRALALWIAYVAGALSGAHRRSMLVVDYSALLAHPGEAVSSLSEFIVHHCDVDTPVPSLEALVALVESDLNRNRGAVAYGVSEAELADVMDIYSYVMKAHLEPDVRLAAPDVPDWVRDALSDARDVWAAQRAADSAGHVIEELQGLLEGEHEAMQDADRLRAEAEERARTWERERLALTQEADQARTATEVLSAELERARDEAEQAQDRLSQAESSLELIRRDSAEQRQSADEARRTLEARLVAREEEATELRLRVASSAAEVQARASEVAQLQRLIEMEQEEHSTQLSSWDAERTDLRRKLDESGSAAAVLSAELERVRLDLAQERQTLELLRDDLRAREQDLADLGEQLADSLGARDAAADQVSSLERALAEVRGQHAAEANSWHRERELLMRGVDEARSEGQELVAQIEVLSADLSQSDEALLEARLASQDLETLRSRHEGIMLALTEQLARKTGLVGSLSARLAEAEKRRLDAEQDVERLTRELAAASLHMTTLESDLSTERGRVRLVEDNVASLEHASAETSRLLNAEIDRSGRLAEALGAAISEGQSLLAEVDGLKASRSYRYGRALTAIGRVFVGGPALPPRIPRYVVAGVEAADVASLVSEGSFDADFYLARYPDIAESGIDPLFHFLAQGRLEGREVQPGTKMPLTEVSSELLGRD
jgi:hypothetical protein